MLRLLTVLLVLWAGPAFALSSSPTACITPKAWVAKTNGKVTPVDLIATPASGAKVTAINVGLTDAANTYYIQLYLNDGSVSYSMGQFLVQAGAGYGVGTTMMNYINKIPGLPYDSDGNRYIFIPPTFNLKIIQGSGTSGGASATATEVMAFGCQFE